ncbi:hypothetical protein XENTR_v10009585 [Xenopus tropicalis]|nr:hypothetical protein XENTR_v10009585 [Xenopus tropicalis]
MHQPRGAEERRIVRRGSLSGEKYLRLVYHSGDAETSPFGPRPGTVPSVDPAGDKDSWRHSLDLFSELVLSSELSFFGGATCGLHCPFSLPV